MIFRGTTPTIILKIKNEDFDMTTISECYLTIQNKSGRNKKDFDNYTVDIENKLLYFALTQEDTLAYESGYIEVQLRIKLVNDKVITHDIITTTIGKILKEGAI